MDTKRVISVLALLAIIAAAFYLVKISSTFFYNPTKTNLEQETISGLDKYVEIVAENLEIPWEIAFLSSGEMLVTERPGRLLKIGKDKTVIEIEGVQHVGEGGLMGLALHPDFENNNLLYLYMTTKVDSGLQNRVERYRLEGSRLLDKETILENIPGAAFHDGGRIAFGPDGHLYITTGDATQENLAQDISSLAGKILRIKDNGSLPEDNPFNNAVYSYGHRNSQGIAWDEKGRLWATEHGRSGALSGLDELNLIEKGKNYGWPLIQGDETLEDMMPPMIQSGPDETWAPAGIAYLNGKLFFAGLRGESLYEATILENGKVTIKANFREKFGRLRAVVIGPDGYLYLSTSNRDGRGNLKDRDDKIIKVNPIIFREEK